MWVAVLSAPGDPTIGPSTEQPERSGAGLESVVRASRRDERLSDLPFAVTVLEEDAINDGRPLQSLGEALDQVPGLLTTSQFNGAQDLRISIRGFGARTTFGVRGIRVLLDGVPLTVPDGQSALDVIDPALVRRIEVLRGPAAAIYGSAASAVIRIETRAPRGGAPWLLRASGGENGLLRGSASVSGRSDDSEWLLAATRAQWRGERDRSEFLASSAVGRLSIRLGDSTRLNVVGLVHDGPRSQDPGALTAEEFETDPLRAGETNERFRTGEQVRQGQLGATLRYQGSRRWVALAQLYGQARQFRGRVPFRGVELDRWVGGARGSVGYVGSWWRLETGLESDLQRDRRRNFPNDDGVVGSEATLRQDEELTTWGWVTELDARLIGDRLRLRGAGRLDRYRYALKDRLLTDGNGGGERSFTVATGLLGAVWRLQPAVDVFSNLSLAYDVPTLSELAESTSSGGTPESGLNPDLGESLIQSAELGVRGGVGAFELEATAFAARSEDEIVANEIADGLTVFENTGASDRSGLELAVRTAVGPLDLSAQASALRSDVEQTGRGIPGASSWLAYGQLRYRDRSGMFAAVETRGRGPVELGSVRSDPVWLGHMRAGYRAMTAFGAAEVVMGVRNVSDERYADNLRPNAFGGRFFEPAPGRWYYASIAVAIGGGFSER